MSSLNPQYICDCEFNDDGYMDQYGKNCNDPFHNIDCEECGHEIKEWEFLPQDLVDGKITETQWKEQEVNCCQCGIRFPNPVPIYNKENK